MSIEKPKFLGLGLFAFFFGVVGSLQSEARVFQFGKESFAGYLRGTYWSQSRKNTLMSESNSTASQPVSLSNNEFTTTKSGEAGFVYTSQFLNMKFGYEMLLPTAIKASSGADAAGTELYQADGEASVAIPKIGVDINLKTFQSSRLFLSVAYGAATLTAKNSYNLTASGTTAYSLASFSENLSSSAPCLEGGLGYEMHFFDTTTFVLEGNYRSLKFTKVKYASEVTNFQGAQAKADAATNTDGSDRVLDLSGPSIGVYLRFYIK